MVGIDPIGIFVCPICAGLRSSHTNEGYGVVHMGACVYKRRRERERFARVVGNSTIVERAGRVLRFFFQKLFVLSSLTLLPLSVFIHLDDYYYCYIHTAACAHAVHVHAQA